MLEALKDFIIQSNGKCRNFDLFYLMVMTGEIKMAERTRRVQSKETWTWDSAGRNWKTGGRETWGGGQKKKWRLRWEKEKTPNDSRCSDWTGKHRVFKNRYLMENSVNNFAC